jgi:WD40 repeat protein
MVTTLACILTLFSSKGQTPKQEPSKSVTVVAKSGPLTGLTAYTDSYALFIGIGKYENPAIPSIPSAPNDALTLKNILVKDFGFNPNKVAVLINAQATKANIEKELANLANTKTVKPTDRVLVYFSGHGQGLSLSDGEGVGYILPFNANVDLKDTSNPASYQTSCLDMEDIVKRLKACPAKHRTLIVDSCFSGFAVGNKSLAGTTYSPEALKRVLDQSGLFVMTAGSSQQEVAGDGSNTGLSLYTRSLIDSLNEGLISGGVLTVEQWAAEAAAKTRTKSHGKQTPQFGQKAGSGQMLLFSSTKEASTTPLVSNSTKPLDNASVTKLATTAILNVTCNVPGAKVEANGKIIPLTSSFELEPGNAQKFMVKVSAPNHKSEFYEVILVAGQSTKLNASLDGKGSPNEHDYTTLTPFMTLYGHQNHVMCVAYSPKQPLLASASADKTIRIWNTKSGKVEKTLYGHSGVVFSLAFSPDGATLASVGDDHNIFLWDTVQWSKKSTLYGHTSYLYSVAYSSNGALLASSGFDKTVRIWNTETGLQKAKLLGHTSQVMAVAFSPDCKTLLSGSVDKSIKIWNVENFTLQKTLLSHSDNVRHIAVSSDGNWFSTSSTDQTVRLWTTTNYTNVMTLNGFDNSCFTSCFSSDNKTLFTGDDNNTIIVWDIRNGKKIKTLKGHGLYGVNSLCLSPDGTELASAGGDGTVRLWRVSD